jgi:sucrose phosphorylase
VVRQLCEMIRFRNQHPAFAGQFQMLVSDDTRLQLRWVNGETWAELQVDFATTEIDLSCSEFRVVNQAVESQGS